MLTPRGLWLLLTTLVLLVFALWASAGALALVCLTVLFWLLGAWLLFAVRVRMTLRRLRAARQVSGERGPVQTLWAGGTFRVRARLFHAGPFPTPYLRVTDRVPYGAEHAAGETWAEGSAATGEPLEVDYRMHCPAAGLLRFEGLGVQASDAQGLFTHPFFVPDVRLYRVLPALAPGRGHPHALKQHNVLPLLGAHRHRRPGTGSELLDLRDYLPGDPPRTIAWKVSARRDRLITKEFESEVPVRCTFFLDVSQSVRVGGPGQNALARLVDIAAAVAQAAAEGRDLTGLCAFDERQVRHVVRPARGRRHVVRLASLLADVAGLRPEAADVEVDALLSLAYGLAREVYPHLLHPDVNAFPAWLPWLFPRPAWTLRLPPLRARSWLHLPGAWLRRLAWRAGLRLRQAVVGRLSSRQRRHYRWRKQLAAILAIRGRLGPGGLSMLLEDDERFVVALQEFLAEHHVPYALPLYDQEGRYLFGAAGKTQVLASALLHAVARGRDNELFVLLADLLELEDHLGPLLGAVKAALARHHQVLVVCPWPAGVRLPAPDAGAGEAGGRLAPKRPKATEIIDEVTVRHLHRAYRQLRRTFGRLSVAVVCARAKEPVRIILGRLERLRVQQRGVP